MPQASRTRASADRRAAPRARGNGPAGRGRTVEALLKSSLILSRTVAQVLENRDIGVGGQPLSQSKLQILRLLGQRGVQFASRVARFLGVSKPAVTQLVDSMVADRLVRRQQSTRDRRGVELTLTARGRSIFRRVQREQKHLVRNALRHISRAHAVQWTAAMEEIAAALARADRTFRGYCLQCGSHEDGTCVLVGGGANCLYLSRTSGTESDWPRSRPRFRTVAPRRKARGRRG